MDALRRAYPHIRLVVLETALTNSTGDVAVALETLRRRLGPSNEAHTGRIRRDGTDGEEADTKSREHKYEVPDIIAEILASRFHQPDLAPVQKDETRPAETFEWYYGR